MAAAVYDPTIVMPGRFRGHALARRCVCEGSASERSWAEDAQSAPRAEP